MKVLHLNAGNETGGGMVHILSLLKELIKEDDQFLLGVFEKGMLLEKAAGLGVRTVTFEQRSRYDFSILSRLIKFIKEEKISIIHTHGARANLYGYLIRKFTNVTWITTVHSDPRNDFLGRGILGEIFTKLHLMVLKKPDHFFAISKRFSEMLCSFGVKANKITTIYNGIDFTQSPKNHGSYRGELKLSQEDFVILMVARFDPVKRHNLAIEAVERFINHHPKTQLLLVGDGPTRKEVEDFVEQRGLESHIQFLGFREDVDALFSMADVTLLTSATESFPLVLLESSREKTPVITTDVGGVRDMIPDSSYSLVLTNSEVSEIVSALQHVFNLKQKHELVEMGERFYQYTSQRFSVQAFAKSIYDTYKMAEK
jgi:glycosyltransferase involved in cell wall biosynthesis